MNFIYKLTSAALLVLFTITMQAQQVNDYVLIGTGYANQSFYSMDNGEISNVSNTDWDLAFQITGFQAAIRINGKNNVRLFRSGLDVSAWNAITANDTIGKLNSTFELFDQDTSWWTGAFNCTNDTSNQFDLGWGVYDFVTHAVMGDSLYFIKIGNGTVKKLWIQSLTSGIYYFVYANVDGTNEITTSLNKAGYTNRNFGYYSIVNDTEINREPNKNDWDLTFCQYMSVTPILYKVTGVLANDSVAVARAYPVDEQTVSAFGQNYSLWNNTIGYDWKTYDFNTNSWLIEDSLVYFVQQKNGNIWKLVFTGFGGTATGQYDFYKEPVSSTGIAGVENAIQVLSMYPNPVDNLVNIVFSTGRHSDKVQLEIFSSVGALVYNETIESGGQIQSHQVSVDKLRAGLYTVRLSGSTMNASQKLLIR